MKMILCSLIACIAATVVNGKYLTRKWQINEPIYTWTAANNKIDLDYLVSGFISETNPSVEIFDGDCGAGANTKTDGFNTTLTVLEGTTTNYLSGTFSSKGRTSKLDVTVDPQTLALDDELCTDNGDNTASIIFCVRYSLNEINGCEATFLEHVIEMNVDLSSGFTVDELIVTPKDKIEAIASKTFQFGW